MTWSEAIKEIETSIELAKMCTQNFERTKEIEAYAMAIKALEKQISKKPSPIDYKKYIDVVKNAKFLRGGFWCPNCKHVVYSGCYCEDCGQKLDWSDEE